MSEIYDPSTEISVSLKDALDILKRIEGVKFDESVDLSFQINNKQKKSEINIRTVVNLPGGTGKKVKVAVVCEEGKLKEAKIVDPPFYKDGSLYE